MRDLLILAIHLVVTFAKVLRPGGVSFPRKFVFQEVGYNLADWKEQ